MTCARREPEILFKRASRQKNAQNTMFSNMLKTGLTTIYKKHSVKKKGKVGI